MGIKRVFLIILIIANIFSWSVVWERSQDRGLEVCFFDVGQGDAIFIETQQGHQILIDGGPDKTIIGKLEKRMPSWDRTIDLIVLTHPDKDHIFGLIEVLERYKVENILWTGLKRDTLLSKRWQKAIEKEGAAVWIARQGLNIRMSTYQNIEILYPFESLENRMVSNINDTSIVIILNAGPEKILFTGDISKRIEGFLIEKEVPLSADILKVSHHGSKTSSSEDFLEAVKPNLAIISVGRNNHYGHPAPDVLARLEDFGIKVLQTSKEKDICLIQKENEPFLLLSPMR